MRTVGHLILMAVICVAVFVVFIAIRPARAWSDVWRPTPWGWQCSRFPYGPARIPPGFRAPYPGPLAYAPEASGHAAAPPSSVMNSRRFK